LGVFLRGVDAFGDAREIQVGVCGCQHRPFDSVCLRVER
jgi:hypothetical protein